MADPLVDHLLSMEEPSVEWKLRLRVLGENPASSRMKAVARRVRDSARVRTLLARLDSETGTLRGVGDIYTKWQGGHWVLSALAELGYPAGDRRLLKLRDRVLDHWLAEYFWQEESVRTKAAARRCAHAVPVMQGRHRQCGSQQGNALFSITRLGLVNSRSAQLAERLMHWQWPDGGWNCDRNPAAETSSFMETLLPMRGLAAFGEQSSDNGAQKAARRAAEVFLCRSLFQRRADGSVIKPDFVRLHYPRYWHYDVLGGLTGMLEVRKLQDRRCRAALDLLESKRLSDGGWPAESAYYERSDAIGRNVDSVGWGGTSKKRMNPWVTVEALSVLTAAKRLSV